MIHRHSAFVNPQKDFFEKTEFPIDIRFSSYYIMPINLIGFISFTVRRFYEMEFVLLIFKFPSLYIAPPLLEDLELEMVVVVIIN